MKKTITVLTLFLTITLVNAQTLYSKAYGDPNHDAIIYLHGGPGYNSMGFEITTAQKLSESGFYVIVYDRRGEGRSPDKQAAFTFQQTLADLDDIYKKFNLNTATLLGHSFGGIIGTLFSENHTKKVKALVMVAAPLSMQETFLTIIKTSKSIYEIKKDSTNLMYIGMLEKMDKTSIAYSSYSFGHAMQNGFYTPKVPSKEALVIYTNLKADTSFARNGASLSIEAPTGFWENENYTSIDLSENLSNLIKNKTPLFGIYGTEDGLYSEEQVRQLKNLMPITNFKYLDNCSHNVFIDQQDQFITALKEWIK